MFFILNVILYSASSTILYNKTMNHNEKIYYIFPVENNIIIWGKNSVQCYNTQNETYISNMTKFYTNALGSGVLTTDISDDKTAILFNFLNVVCYYFMNTTIYASDILCLSFQIGFKVNQTKFLNSRDMFLVSWQTGGYKIYKTNILPNNTIDSINIYSDNTSWPYNISRVARDTIRQRVYIMTQTNNIFYININPFSINFNQINQLYLENSLDKKINLIALDNGDLLIQEQNNATLLYKFRVYTIDFQKNIGLIHGIFNLSGKSNRFVNIDGTLNFCVSTNEVFQISLQQNTNPNQYLQLINNSSHSLSVTTISFNIISFNFTIISNERYFFVHQFLGTQVHYFKLKTYKQCIQAIENCQMCNLLNSINQCIKCKIPAILTSVNGNNICLIPDIFIRQNNSTCPQEYYTYIDDPTLCLKIICQVQNCDQCLYRSDICNKCNTDSILIQGDCLTPDLYRILKQYGNIAGIILSVPGIRYYAAPLSPLFIWLDDYWYYIFHNRNYSIGLKIVFDTIKFINQLKITPQFINLDDASKKLNVSILLGSNYKYYTPSSFYKQSFKDIQFLKNTNQMYTWNYICGIMMFILYRIIFKIFVKCIKPENGSILDSIKVYFVQNSMYKCFYIIFIEANLIFITFYAFIQLAYPSSFNLNDKFNVIFAVIFLFASMFFSFNFYILIYALYKKQEAEMFLTFTKGNNAKGYISQTFQICLKNFFSGFIHAYLINNYFYQIIFLAGLKIILAGSVITLKKSYLNNGIFISFLFYFLIGASLDVFLLLENEKIIYSQINDKIQILFVILMMIALLICFLSLLYALIKQKCSNYIKRSNENYSSKKIQKKYDLNIKADQSINDKKKKKNIVLIQQIVIKNNNKNQIQQEVQENKKKLFRFRKNDQDDNLQNQFQKQKLSQDITEISKIVLEKRLIKKLQKPSKNIELSKKVGNQTQRIFQVKQTKNSVHLKNSGYRKNQKSKIKKDKQDSIRQKVLNVKYLNFN